MVMKMDKKLKSIKEAVGVLSWIKVSEPLEKRSEEAGGRIK
jgi:hypothetical protein